MKFAILLLVSALAGLAQRQEGFVDVPGGPVWYRITRPDKGIPLVVLHGGPGGTSCSFSRLESGIDQTVVTYDQLGSGRSGRPNDPSLWNVDRFVEELDVLRKNLGLKRMHLMGHSWGASLAAAYVLAKGTAGIESLILSSPLLSTSDWIRDAQLLKKQLPPQTQRILERHEAAGTTDDPEYHEAEQEYTKRFVRRSARVNNPDCVESLPNRQIYQQMWGPTEFHATGTLKSFDVTSQFSKLKLPVLLIVGEFDEATPTTAARYHKLIVGSKLVVVPGAAHSQLNDNPDAALKALRTFLSSTEKNTHQR
jgi:proline iminopeptidase